MQYVTTVNKSVFYSPDEVLFLTQPSEGGYFLPLHIPKLSMDVLHGQSCNDTIAHVINLFFSTQLTGRDVDLAIGKFPARLFHMNHRISVIESWHNLDWDFARMVKNLTAQIRDCKDTEQAFGIWPQIAIRAAVICGAYTQAFNQGTLERKSHFDIAVPSGDFSCVMSAWICRQMRLPIQNIVVCCNENNNLWDFLNHGELRTGRTALPTNTPECDKTIPELIEMLISFCGTEDDVYYFIKCAADGRTYFLSEEIRKQIDDGFHVSVIGQSRTETTISGVYRTHGYVLGPYSALTYAGALDYRAGTGENRHIMLLSEKGALLHDEYVAKSLGTTVADLHIILDS